DYYCQVRDSYSDQWVF
nr:immunoglobulin light chain junction region [Macaca mulatta]MOV73235.1 immunoglobulin light chain junction region [Macaca mulatta]MOV73718.1 immunoglobulin light chain junction region [Macaca mulatta]MOV74185.1 immunoglobulin light chain junction region [Macaca mulatta]